MFGKKKYNQCRSCGDKHTETYPMLFPTSSGKVVELYFCEMCATFRRLDLSSKYNYIKNRSSSK